MRTCEDPYTDTANDNQTTKKKIYRSGL